MRKRRRGRECGDSGRHHTHTDRHTHRHTQAHTHTHTHTHRDTEILVPTLWQYILPLICRTHTQEVHYQKPRDSVWAWFRAFYFSWLLFLGHALCVISGPAVCFLYLRTCILKLICVYFLVYKLKKCLNDRKKLPNTIISTFISC